MPTIKYSKNPNVETAFVEQDDGSKNRVILTAPQDISTIEYPSNPNSTKAYVTVNGKKQRVIMTADISGGGGGSSLPDQTGHSGEFLTTDGTDASWAAVDTLPDQTGQSGKFLITDGTDASWGTISALQNTATGTDSLTILGTASNKEKSLNIGVNSSIDGLFGTYGVAIGYGANASGAAVSCGMDAQATGQRSVSLGYAAKTSALSSIQINASGSTKTNSDANTFKVANYNGNFEIMSADGTIPTARLTKVNTIITLAAADWSSNTQSVTVSGMTATGVVFVSPDPTDQADYTSAGILCTAQAAGTLTFTCDTVPSGDIDVNVVML